MMTVADRDFRFAVSEVYKTGRSEGQAKAEVMYFSPC